MIFFTHSKPIFPYGVSTTELNSSQDCPWATSVEEPTAAPFSYNVHSHLLLQEIAITDTKNNNSAILFDDLIIFIIVVINSAANIHFLFKQHHRRMFQCFLYFCHLKNQKN